MGGGGWLLIHFFSIIYILGLVCYKHTIHAMDHLYAGEKYILIDLIYVVMSHLVALRPPRNVFQ